MIRPATHDDIDRLAELGAMMHAESRYSKFPIDLHKVRALFAHLIESPDGLLIVSEADGAIAGGFAGYVVEHYFAHTLVANEFGLFVDPEYRGGMSAPRLLKAYIDWAKSKGAVVIHAGITTGVHVDESTKLYKRLGFEPAGNLFEIEV